MQVTEHIHALRIPFEITVGPEIRVDRFVNVYLIFGPSIQLIDCGVAGSEKQIFDCIREAGRSPTDISQIILTHSHPDHLGAAQAIQQISGCKIAAHHAAQEWIEHVDVQEKARPIPGFHSLVGDSVKLDQLLNDGDVLDLGEGRQLEVLHTPGHSAGSISLVLRADKALFSGDAIPVAGDIPIYEDAAAEIASIRKLTTIDDIEVLLSSWDEPRKGGQVFEIMDKALEYLQHIHETVLKKASSYSTIEPMKLCEEVVLELGLPPTAVNPPVAKTFMSHLKIDSNDSLL